VRARRASGFSAELARLPKTIEHTTVLRGRFDLVQAFFTRKAPLVRSVAKLKKAIEPAASSGWPIPRATALGTDLNRDVCVEAIASQGLDTVAQVAIDDVWSAIRCKVIES
jgi:hypothetical protein